LGTSHLHNQTMDTSAVTTAQAAAQLGVSPQTIQKWVDAGHLPAWRTVGGHRRLDAAAVERMVRERNSSVSTPGGRTLDVVLVEDNPLTLELLREQLRQAFPHARVRACTDAVSGLLEVGRVVPDVLLSDVNLPGFDGLAMLARLRQNPQTRGMKVILVTNYSPSELRESFGEPPAGVPVLQKPLMDGALKGAVEQVLALAAPQQAALDTA
jgi:excisionase family DNA binding protein